MFCNIYLCFVIFLMRVTFVLIIRVGYMVTCVWEIERESIRLVNVVKSVKKKKRKKKIWLQQVGFPFFLVCHIFHGYGYIGYGYGDNEDIMMEWWLL